MNNKGFNGEYDAPYIRQTALVIVTCVIGLFALVAIL